MPLNLLNAIAHSSSLLVPICGWLKSYQKTVLVVFIPSYVGMYVLGALLAFLNTRWEIWIPDLEARGRNHIFSKGESSADRIIFNT